MKQMNCEFCTPSSLICVGYKKKIWLVSSNWSACVDELKLEIEVTMDFVLRNEF